MNQTSRETDVAVELAASRWIARRDAGMSAAEEAEFERWLAEPRHARAFARHEATWKKFDLPVMGGDAEVMIAALAASRAQRRRRVVRGVAVGAAACVLASALWVQSGRVVRRENTIEVAAAASRAVVTRPEKETLPDGSVVELKSGAQIRIAFSPDARRVILERGEAFFQVAKNQVPFVVAAQGIEVRAVGTAFSVQLGAAAVDVLVTEGRVAVEKSGAPSAAEARTETAPIAMLDAANRLIVDLGSTSASSPAAVPVTSAQVDERLAWRTPRLDFTDTPLATAVEFFNRHAEQTGGVKLRVDPKDARLARLEVTGYFRADNVETFVHLVEQTLGIKAERREREIILRRDR